MACARPATANLHIHHIARRAQTAANRQTVRVQHVRQADTTTTVAYAMIATMEHSNRQATRWSVTSVQQASTPRFLGLQHARYVQLVSTVYIFNPRKSEIALIEAVDSATWASTRTQATRHVRNVRREEPAALLPKTASRASVASMKQA